MTPTASGLDEARERLTTVDPYQELGPSGYTDVAIVALSDLRLLLASEAALREALKPFAAVAKYLDDDDQDTTIEMHDLGVAVFTPKDVRRAARLSQDAS